MKYILFLLIAFPILSSGQPDNQILSVCGHKVGNDICSQVPTHSLCQLDGLTFNTNGYTVDNDPVEAYTSLFCGSGTFTHNDLWIGFTAQQSKIHLKFDNHGCQSTSTCRGTQAGIFDTDCKTGATFCNTLVCVNCVTSSFDLIYNNLVPGQFYYIMLDGCCADVCEYTINVIDGLPEPSFSVTLPQNTELCYTDSELFHTSGTICASVDPIDGDYIYEWTAFEGGAIIGSNTSKCVEINRIGGYQVIVREPVNCCKAESYTWIFLSDTAPIASAAVSGTLSPSTPNVTLTGSFTYPTMGEYVYSWQDHVGNLVSNSGELIVNVDTPGDYIFSVYEKNTYCLDTERVTVIQTTDILNFEIENKIKITPNPANNWITFEAQSNINSIEIIDIYGKVVAILESSNTKVQYDVHALSEGIYLVKVWTKIGLSVEKFEVIR